MIYYFILLLNIVFLVTGQFLWKSAVEGVSLTSISVFLSVILKPAFLGGAFLYVIATGLWLVVLSKIPLHQAYPIQALSYVLVAFISFAIFKVPVTSTQWLGIAVITFGIYLIAK